MSSFFILASMATSVANSPSQLFSQTCNKNRVGVLVKKVCFLLFFILFFNSYSVCYAKTDTCESVDSMLLTECIVEATVTTTTSTASSGNKKMGISFGPEHQSSVRPGIKTFYTHTLSPQSNGNVTFSAAGSGHVDGGWTNTLYHDADCDGSLNESERNTPISGTSFAMTAGSKICIVNKVYAPTSAPIRDRYKVDITAIFTFPNHATRVLVVTDLTIRGRGESRLILLKTIENLTQKIPETEIISPAPPGDVLKYRIYYRNAGSAGPVRHLQISDTLPPFTSFIEGSASCGVLPPEEVDCTPTYHLDSLSWAFTGVLLGRSSGSVSYKVSIDN